MLGPFRKLRLFGKTFFGRVHINLVYFKLILARINRRKAEPRDLRIHFLIVEKEIYAKALRTAVVSLLHHNPNVHITFHLDGKIKEILNKKIWTRLIGKDFKYSNVEGSDWRLSKLFIIVGISGTRDIFCDADLRFHSPIPKLDGIQFFVNEGPKLKEYPYKDFHQTFCSKEQVSVANSAQMLNTSIFTWGGLEINAEERELLFRAFRFFDAALEKSGKSRLSEQIALSFLAQARNFHWTTWKESDYWMDGKFIDSTYTGNSGITF